MKVSQIFKSLAATTFLLVGSSLVFSLGLEKGRWSFGEAFEFCCVTLATVGYGNLRPSSDGSRAFTIMFILIGWTIVIHFFISSISAFINALVNYSTKSRLNALYRLSAKQQRIAVVSLAVFVFNLVLASVLFAFVFNDRDISFIECVYAAVVTLSTVGFGDYSIGKKTNHILGGVFVLLSTAVSAWCLSAMIAVVSLTKQKKLIETKLNAQEVMEADADGDQILSKTEFVLYKLKKMALIDDDVLASLEQQFLIEQPPIPTSDDLENETSDALNDDNSVELETQPLLQHANTKPHHHQSKKAFIFNLLFGTDDTADKVDIFIKIIIIIAVCGFVFSTVPDWNRDAPAVFDAIEWIVSPLFTLEYVIRIAVCTEDPAFHQYGSGLGRLRYMVTIPALIDFLSIAPFYVALMLGNDSSVRFSGALRALRLARVLKMDTHNKAVKTVMLMLRANLAVLITASTHALIALLVFATLLYFTEQHGIYANEFNSIPKSIYFTLIFMTGEMPLYDFTTPGKIIVCFLAIIAVSVFAVPTAILGAGFAKSVELVANEEDEADADNADPHHVRCPNCRTILPSSLRVDLDDV